MTHRRRRSWTVRARGRNPLVRTVDRVEFWSIVLVLVAMICAVPAGVHVSHAVQSAEARTIKVEAATRHQVDAVALADTEVRTRGLASSFRTQVQWFDNAATRDRFITIPQRLTKGDHVRVWVDDRGELAAAPRAPADARSSGVGAALMVWFTAAVLAFWTVAALRRVFERRRDRAWDRTLRFLVDYGDGSNAHDPRA